MTANKFSLDIDGNIIVTAKMSFTDFSELPTSIAHASADHISTDQTPQGKAGFVALLNVAALFLPDEIQQNQLIGEMCDRRKGEAPAAPVAPAAQVPTDNKSKDFIALAANVEKRAKAEKAAK